MWNSPLTLPEFLHPTQLLRHFDVSRQITFSPPWNLPPPPLTVNNYTYTSPSTEIHGFSPQVIVVPCLEYIYILLKTKFVSGTGFGEAKTTYTSTSYILLRSFRLGLGTDPLFRQHVLQ